MMSFVATFLLGGLIQTAAAVDWPDLSELTKQAIKKAMTAPLSSH